MTAVNYDAYLRSEAWRAKRAEALDRAGHRCQLCNAGRQLEVHHRTYDRLGREHSADLTVPCGRCHLWHHWRLELLNAPKDMHDPIRAVQTALREWSTRVTRARGDLGELAAAKGAMLCAIRAAFTASHGQDAGAEALMQRQWVRTALVKLVADATGYSERLVDDLLSPEPLEAAA